MKKTTTNETSTDAYQEPFFYGRLQKAMALLGRCRGITPPWKLTEIEKSWARTTLGSDLAGKTREADEMILAAYTTVLELLQFHYGILLQYAVGPEPIKGILQLVEEIKALFSSESTQALELYEFLRPKFRHAPISPEFKQLCDCLRQSFEAQTRTNEALEKLLKSGPTA